ncbi:GCG_CRPN prefix-to-repeats domain-containing protein [Methylorubrum extorquens]
MRLKALAVLAAIVGGTSFVTAAEAAPVPMAPAGAYDAGNVTTTVAMGCGRGWVRTPYGRCRPMFGPRRFGGPRCFIRRTPFGPRRVCR